MDSYLEMILFRQQADSGAVHSGAVLKKLNEEIIASVGKAEEAPPAAPHRREAALAEKEASERKRDAALTQMAAQITESFWGETMLKRDAGATEKPEETAGEIRYGVVPMAWQQEGLQEQTSLSMDALSRFFERDARRYPE